MATIENDLLRVSIRPQGAELTSIFHKPTGTEHLWQADPAVWGWHAPNLFPVVGGCLNNQLRIGGQTYPMARHGFARQSAFTRLEGAADRAVFSLRSDAQTAAQFPYEFDFQVHYVLRGSRLSVTYRVQNRGDAPMYFSVGAHPAFAVPFGPGERYDDYVLAFEYDEPLETHQLSDAGFFTGETRPIDAPGGALRLHAHLFDRDALVFKNLRSRRVSLRSAQHNRAVTVSFADFPYLGLWAKPGVATPGAPFVCIEPWLGCADTEGRPTDISQKEAIQHVGAGGTFSAQFLIDVT